MWFHWFNNAVKDVVSEIDECYTDDNGKGKFHYQPRSGFLALCENK